MSGYSQRSCQWRTWTSICWLLVFGLLTLWTVSSVSVVYEARALSKVMGFPGFLDKEMKQAAAGAHSSLFGFLCVWFLESDPPLCVAQSDMELII